MRKQDRQRFVREANKLIESLGATRDCEYRSGDYWRLDTICGPLWLLVDDDQPTGIGAVYTHFGEPKEALPLTDCNPHSGKWNHHYSDNWHSVDNAIKDLTYELRRIRQWPTT